MDEHLLAAVAEEPRPPTLEFPMIRSANPYLNFPGNTEEAFNFYRSVFGGELTPIVRFRDLGENHMGIPEEQLDLVAHVSLPLGTGQMLMGTDVVGSQSGATSPEYANAWQKGFVVGTNYYTLLEVESAAAAEQIFEALSSGGTEEMPLMATEWSEKYGSCRDRYGVQWMVSYTGNVVFP
jgi:PhnB protein